MYLVKDLIDETGKFLDYKAFSEKYEITVNFLDYVGCIRSIKQYMMYANIEIQGNKYNTRTRTLQILASVSKGAKIFYDILMEELEILDILPFVNWEQKLKSLIDWHGVLKKIKKIKEIKLKWFQLRICFRILVTNNVLKKMGITDSEKCSFCGVERDSIDHYLWDCTQVHCFWTDLEHVMKERCGHCVGLTFSKELILFGIADKCTTDEVFETIILCAKFFVYKCRFNKVKPNVEAFLKELQYRYNMEKYTHILNMQYYEFQRKWMTYNMLID